MEIKELSIEGERVFVKKSNIFGWGFVKPAMIYGKRNWKNILIGGSSIKFGLLIFVLLVIAGVTQEYSTAVNIANECRSPLSQPIYILP